nr:type II-A CRISPR-associated protein Csn2 [uncultured Leptotrichia sp.]
MKLINEDLNNEIIFEENKVNLLVVENKKKFVEFIQEIIKQINGNEGKFFLFDKNTELKIHNKVEIIKDIFDLDINNKKILNKIYHELEELSIDSEFLLETKNMESNLLKYIYCLIEKYDYPLEIIEGLDLKEIFKLLSVKLSLCFSNKIEEILEYIDLVSRILKKEIFVLVNFHIFLEKDDIVALCKECFYKKIKLLFVENQKPDIINNEEKLFIIDNDLREINLS